jgi:putative ATPase
LRNAPTKLAKEQGHGAGYRYAHDFEGGVAQLRCLPEALGDARFYEPGDRGFEERVAAQLAAADRLRRAAPPPAEEEP